MCLRRKDILASPETSSFSQKGAKIPIHSIWNSKHEYRYTYFHRVTGGLFIGMGIGLLSLKNQ